MACNTLVKATVCEDTEGSGQVLFAIQSFVF
jgi:hypothetical protein